MRESTPAEHADTVLQSFANGAPFEVRAAARTSLNALVALAERAAELERERDEAIQSWGNWMQEATEQRLRAERAERDAENLRLGYADRARMPIPTRRLMDRIAEAEERAEQAEAALREIRDYYAAEYAEGDKAYQAVIVARAALARREARDG